MIRNAMIGLAMLAGTSPLAAAQYFNGMQIVENFEARPLGPVSINFCNVVDPADACFGTLTGGSISAASPAFPDASTGSQVYAGTLISLAIADFVFNCWPAANAFVSGTAPIHFRAWAYNSQTDVEDLVADLWTSGNDINTPFGFGDDGNIQFLTRIEYRSTATFAIDDLAMGLFDVAPGIPEPSSWLMLIAGFGLTGAAMRRSNRRKVAAPTG